jgi:hypothetical protein
MTPDLGMNYIAYCPACGAESLPGQNWLVHKLDKNGKGIKKCGKVQLVIKEKK